MVKKLTAEILGSLLLGASVVGSGLMVTILTQDIAVQLFINTITTVFMLFLIITLFSPISGAHFNPLVTLVELVYRRISIEKAFLYILAQLIGTSTGVIIANVMFNRPAVQMSTYSRTGNYLRKPSNHTRQNLKRVIYWNFIKVSAIVHRCAICRRCNRSRINHSINSR